MPVIAASGPLIFDCLSAAEPALTVAAIAALALLEPEDLAPYTQAAADVWKQQHNSSLAKLAARSSLLGHSSAAAGSAAGAAAVGGTSGATGTAAGGMSRSASE